MRHSLKLSALLAMLLASVALLGGAGVGAQDADDELLPSDLTGIQHGVARAYTVDFSAFFNADASTPVALAPGLLSLSGIILEFDNDENAAEAATLLWEEFASEGLSGESVEEIDLGVGESNSTILEKDEMDGEESESVLTVVQESNYVYMVLGIGSDVDVAAAIAEHTQSMIDTDGSGEGEFSEDGTSSGGLWDKFPASDSEMLAGLIVADEIIYPEPDGTPVA